MGAKRFACSWAARQYHHPGRSRHFDRFLLLGRENNAATLGKAFDPMPDARQIRFNGAAQMLSPTFRRLVSKVNNIFGKRNRGKTEYGDVQGLS